MSENKEELRYNPLTISYISVYSPPTKTTYFAGEYFDFLTAKFNFGVENRKWTLDYGFGWFDVGISLNFGEIIKSFLKWLSGGK